MKTSDLKHYPKNLYLSPILLLFKKKYFEQIREKYLIEAFMCFHSLITMSFLYGAEEKGIFSQSKRSSFSCHLCIMLDQLQILRRYFCSIVAIWSFNNTQKNITHFVLLPFRDLHCPKQKNVFFCRNYWRWVEVTHVYIKNDLS